GRIFVQQVADAGRDGPAVSRVLHRGVVLPVVADFQIVDARGRIFLVVGVGFHTLDPLDAVAHAPLVPRIGQIGGAGELRIVDHAQVVFQRIFFEQLIRDFRVLSDAQVEQRRAGADILAVTQGVVQALHIVRRQVDVAVVDRQLAVGGVTLDQTAETVVRGEIAGVRVVAAGQDLAGTRPRDAVLHLDLIVVDGESQIAPTFRQARLQDHADRHVGRGLGRQAGVGAAGGDDFNAGGRLPVG